MSIPVPSPFRRGVELLSHGRIRSARRPLRRAVLAGGPETVWAVQELVQSYLRRGETEAAEAALREILPEGSALLEHGLGYLERRTGRAEVARPRFERVLAMEPRLWASANELGFLLCRSGREREGLALLRASERSFRRAGDAWGEAMAVTLRGTHALMATRLREAERLLAVGERLKRSCGDVFGLVNVLHNQALTHYYREDYERALAKYEEALESLESIRDRVGTRSALIGIGVCYSDLAEPERATEAWRRALHAARRSPDRETEAAVRGNLGFASRLCGDDRAALRHYREALRLLPVGSDPDIRGNAIANLAEAFTRAGRASDAQHVLATFTPRESALANRHTRFLLDTEVARVRLASGDAPGALQAARHAVQAARRDEKAWDRIETEAIAAAALLETRRPQEALRQARRSAARLERLIARQPSPSLRMGLLEASRVAQDTLIRCLLARSEDGARVAWEANAVLRARELARPRRAIRYVLPPRLLELERRIRALSTRAQRAQDAGPLLRRLRRDWLREIDRHPRAHLANRERIRRSERLLRLTRARDLVVLDYHVARDDTFVFTIVDGQVQCSRLNVGEKALRLSIDRLLEPLRMAGEAADPRPFLELFDLDLARELHGTLVEPALREVPDRVSRLIVVPEGPLHALPFELLIATQSPDVPGYRLLLESRVVSYSLSSLHLVEAAPKPAQRGFLAVAWSPHRGASLQGPDGPIDLARLPHALEEAREVARCHRGGRVLAGSDATVEAYTRLAPDSLGLHFAAHALPDLRAPGLAAIVLAPASPEASADLLTAERIAHVPLRARLVTLSACATGQGRIRAREGILGLARAFLQAGAGAVVATLWPVDDLATRRVMVELHRRVARGVPPAEALAAAKLELTRDAGERLRHPFFWAPFTLLERRPEGRRTPSPPVALEVQ